jgi:hypothetical protein
MDSTLFLTLSLFRWGMWSVLVHGLQLEETRITSGLKPRKVGMSSPSSHILLWRSWRARVVMAEQEDQSNLDHWVTAWSIAVLESCPEPQEFAWVKRNVRCHESISFGMAVRLSRLERACCSKPLSWVLCGKSITQLQNYGVAVFCPW